MTRLPPPSPLPAPEDRAYVPELVAKYKLPKATLYRMLADGTLPAWHVGSRKLCTSWPAVRAFFGERGG